MKRIFMLLLIAVCFGAYAMGATVNFASDLASESNSVTGTNQLIYPHPAWQPNSATASWISYDETGYYGFSPANTDTTTPTASFFETLMLGGTVTNATMTVWADDTTSVYVNNVLLQAMNPIQDGACAAGPIACEPSEGLTLDLTSYLVSGANTIRFDAFQRDGGPFGIMYEGSASTVPEPGTIGMLGAGLAGLAYYARKRAL